MTKFWVRIFALTFAIGVATGIVMEFEFGTNWRRIPAMSATYLAVPSPPKGFSHSFWNPAFWRSPFRLGKDPATHSLLSYAHGLSWCAFQRHCGLWSPTPGNKPPPDFISLEKVSKPRAKITDFWAMVLNP